MESIAVPRRGSKKKISCNSAEEDFNVTSFSRIVRPRVKWKECCGRNPVTLPISMPARAALLRSHLPCSRSVSFQMIV